MYREPSFWQNPRKPLHQLQSLFNPAGGVIYHYLALKYARSLWKPFVSQIHEWLDTCPFHGKRLVLIGPSGGYSLSPSFLSRFERIVLIDPDFLAHRIFKLRFRQVLKGKVLKGDTNDYFGPRQGGFFNPRFLEPFFERYAGDAMLFCNFLGQVALLNSNKTGSQDSFQEWKKEFLRLLKENKNPWASFHDRLSATRPFLIPESFNTGEVAPSRTTQELLKWLKPGGGEDMLEVVDHQLENLCSDQDVKYFQWELYPKHYHLIEAVLGNTYLSL